MKNHQTGTTTVKKGSDADFPQDRNRTDAGIIIAEWRATKAELLRVILCEHQGRTLIDVRRWFYDASRKLSPTKKGLSLGLDDVKPLRKALRDAARKAERRLAR